MGGKAAPKPEPTPVEPPKPVPVPDANANPDAPPAAEAKTSYATQEAAQAEQGDNKGLGSTGRKRRDPAAVASSAAAAGPGNLSSSAVLTG